MLTANTFNLTFPFADDLTALNKEAVAHPSGILNALVNASAPFLDQAPSDMSDEDYLCYIGNSMQALGHGPDSTYMAVFGGLVDTLAPLVSKHISHARTVVSPLVAEFAKLYAEYLGNNTAKTASGEFNVISLKTPDVLTDESFLGEVAYIRGQNVRQPEGYLSLGPRSVEEILELLKTGSARLDKAVQAWALSKEAGWLESVWGGVFGIGAEAGLPTLQGYEGLRRGSPVEIAEANLAAFLLSRNLLRAAPEDAKQGLSAFQDLAVQVKDYAATGVIYAVERIAQANSTKTLVWETDVNGRVAKVNGDLYAGWLDAGGSVETILGGLVSGDLARTISVIDEKAKEYQAAWNNFVVLFGAKEINSRSDYIRSTLKGMFASHLAIAQPEEKDVREQNANFQAKREEAANVYIDTISLKELEDVYCVSLYLVGKIRFDYTSAFYILSDIQEATRVNPNIDVREAATLAAVNYLGDSLAEQIAVRTL